ncbi:tubulin/FtsZ family protein [Halogeometricum borinquense]|uniref:tubulin/FtsZ family protein n=1 Tax=Halogeometricum borinquense TaxID=60847 RepID=UPI0034270B43
MRLVLLGIGQAGGKIVDRFLEYERQTEQDFIEGAVAFNTARADLKELSHVPEHHRQLFGEVDAKGHGVGADTEFAADLAEQDAQQLIRSLDDIPTSRADAFLVVAGLGGGTGSGAAPVLANELDRIYEKPVYGLGVLPASEEEDIFAYNAVRSFRTLVNHVDNLLLFDNDTWLKSGEEVTEAHDRLNGELVRRLSVLFNAGEVTDENVVAESVIDSSEIINTLRGGGVSTIGHASSTLPTDDSSGFSLGNLFGSSDDEPDEIEAMNRITTAARKATRGRLTLPCDVSSSQRALVVTSGPPQWLSRKGIEQSRQWIEEETESMEIRGGDDPRSDSDRVSVTVLFAGVTDIPRIEQLRERALKAAESSGDSDDLSETELDDFADSSVDGSDLKR